MCLFVPLYSSYINVFIKMEPHFRSLNLTDTVEAAQVKEANKGKQYTRPPSLEGVLDKAKKSLSQHNGDLVKRKHLLGYSEVQVCG